MSEEVTHSMEAEESEISGSDFEEAEEEKEAAPASSQVPFRGGRKPFRLEVIASKRERQKRFSKRKKTLFKQGAQISVLTKAKVDIKVKAESGKLYRFSYPEIQYRDVKIQVGPASVTKAQRDAVRSSPPTSMKQWLMSSPEKRHIPGASSPRQPAIETPRKKRKKTKCAVCKKVFDSEDDEKFFNFHGPVYSKWIGCDVANCKTWAHVLCSGVQLFAGIAVEDTPFTCWKH